MAVREPHVITELDSGKRIAALIPDRARWTIGRDIASDLSISWDRSVSRIHASIERLGPLLVVEDSGVSTNGTFVSDRRAVGRTRLHDLDEIRCGETTLLIRLPNAAENSLATIAVTRDHDRQPNLDLTPAELRVVAILAAPRLPGDAIPSNREIAETLGVHIETVKSHLKATARKLAATGVRGPIDRQRLTELAAEGVLGGSVENEMAEFPEASGPT